MRQWELLMGMVAINLEAQFAKEKWQNGEGTNFKGQTAKAQ